jgi:GNAT superfamily N-acetyltransferase
MRNFCINSPFIKEEYFRNVQAGGVPAMDVLISPQIQLIYSMCVCCRTLLDESISARSQTGMGLSLLLNDKSGLSIVLVAEKDDEIIGMCSVQALISTAEGGPVGLLEDLIVRKEHRGNGIGTRILSEIFRWCETKKISRLQLLRDLDNDGALKFYAGNGWAETRLVCMRKML